MLTVYSPAHAGHAPEFELHRGAMVPCFERPSRAENVLAAVRAAGHEVVGPAASGMDAVQAAHGAGYLAFLRTAHGRWRAGGRQGDAVPHAWPDRRGVVPDCLLGQLGYYVNDAGTPITAGTWDALSAGADCVQTAVDALADRPAAFALTRPPGHHAAASLGAGYCLVNFAAVAAETMLAGGSRRVAILDVDYHHGNGTQAIFEGRGDVLFASIHADPHAAYPYFSGHGEERGVGLGEGATLNLPLPDGTAWPAYGRALETALTAVADFGAERLVLSLGLDAYKDDPISTFALETADFARVGRAVTGLGVPTCVVLEGGYHLPSVGANAAAALTGWNR